MCVLLVILVRQYKIHFVISNHSNFLLLRHQPDPVRGQDREVADQWGVVAHGLRIFQAAADGTQMFLETFAVTADGAQAG
jgi:hypothetical protein